MSAPTVEPAAVTAGAAQHTGAMIALIPTDEDCDRLAIDGYEPAQVLHTTLVFLGEAADWDNQARDILEGTIRDLETTRALRGDVWAHAQFNPNGTDPCAVYLVGAPGIEDLHSAVLGAVEETTDWFPQIPDQHTPWIPHITAGYGLPATELSDTGPVTFDRIRLSFADEDIRDIALTNTSERLVAAAEAGYLDDPAALTASAATGIPVAPPAEWFNDPQLDGPTPITVTPEGRIYGTLASFDSCHIGFGDECVPPPKSKTDYAYFCNGLVLTADGTDVHTGRITMGTGHAGLRMKPRVAAAHYDDTGTCVADVTAGHNQHGIWVAGAIRPGTTDEQLRALRASPLSGDWREINGNLELVAALAVNVPGFNIPRPKSLAASGRRSLTAAGVVPVDYRKSETPSAPATPADRTTAQYFSTPELTASIAREVRASRIRETHSEKLAARIRSARVDAATRRIALIASGRTVRTPAGANHYGQPVGSRIIEDAPDVPHDPEPEPVRSIDPQYSSTIDDIAQIYRGGLYYRIDDPDENTQDMTSRLREAYLPHDELYVEELRARIDAQRRPVPDWPGGEMSQPSAEEVIAITAEWRYSSFYDYVDEWRNESRALQQSGWDRESLPGPDDWEDNDADEWSYNPPPSVGPLLAAIAHTPETEVPIYRGMSVNQEYLDQLNPGAELSMGMSSFTADASIADIFARNPTGDGRHADLGEDATIPVVLTVEPGARAVSLEPERELQAEHVSLGQFTILNRTQRDGIHYVTVRQTSPLEAAA